jgi:hypothetical protein
VASCHELRSEEVADEGLDRQSTWLYARRELAARTPERASTFSRQTIENPLTALGDRRLLLTIAAASVEQL